MSSNFAGVTFENQAATPSDDAVIRRAILSDGILDGCELSYTGSTLTMAAGQMIICGRQVKHPSTQNWAVADETTGYARLLLTIDLTRTSTKDNFDQVVDTIEYASSIDGFASLVQEDINASGTKYQIVAAVVSLAAGGISAIVDKLGQSSSSLGSVYAVIDTTYPAGATCTCSLGSKTLTAPDTSGQALFIVPYAGEWVVTIRATGQQPKSQTVSVTDSKAYFVEIIFGLILFSDTVDKFTDGFIVRNSAYTENRPEKLNVSTTMELSAQAAAGIRTHIYGKDEFDSSKYSILKVMCSFSGLPSPAFGSSYNGVGVCTPGSYTSSIKAATYTDTSGEQILTVDISELDTVAFYASVTSTPSNEAATLKISRVEFLV